jgi:hypothetical protein
MVLPALESLLLALEKELDGELELAGLEPFFPAVKILAGGMGSGEIFDVFPDPVEFSPELLLVHETSLRGRNAQGLNPVLK